MNETWELAERFLEACRDADVMAATAESCTGGMIIAALTDIAGSSLVVDRGFITYSNEAKIDMLGVLPATLERHGAVSGETALQMCSGALARSKAGIALAVTGIAGPDGGSADKPVGLVWFGIAQAGHRPHIASRIFDNLGRDHIRRETVWTALELGLAALGT